ncbi:MAG TPA: hypothetical protein VGL73_08785 [Caulobacteraceae bacterium]
MRIISTTLMAGVAAIACVGVAAMAASPKSQTLPSHVLTVRLPDGSVEQIQYSGDVAPRVRLSAGGMPMGALAPMAGLGPASDASPFAMLERMSAQMDREMAEMMRNAPLMPALAAPGGMQQAVAGRGAALAKLPSGTESYSFVSSISGGKACTHSVQITSRGPGRAPQVVSQTSGDCVGQTSAPRTAPTAAGAVHERGSGKVVA